MSKKILVVVDVQNDFIDGSLRNDEAINKIPNIVKKINEFNGDYIFVTRDTHDYDYMTTNEGKYLPVAHCIKNTDGWYINSDVLAALHKKELLLRVLRILLQSLLSLRPRGSPSG